MIDSINNLFLLPTSQYKPGVPPPAHLSPFIDNEAEGYVPMRHKEIQHLKGEEVVESDDDEEIPEVVPEKKSAKKEKATKKEEVEKPVKGKKSKEARGDADSSSDEDESDDEPKAQTATERRAADAKLKKDLAAEQKEMAKVLMTNR